MNFTFDDITDAVFMVELDQYPGFVVGKYPYSFAEPPLSGGSLKFDLESMGLTHFLPSDIYLPKFTTMRELGYDFGPWTALRVFYMDGSHERFTYLLAVGDFDDAIVLWGTVGG